MSSKTSIADRLRRILPFITHLSNPSDRVRYMSEFRRLYAEDPFEFVEAYDRCLEELRRTVSQDLVSQIEDCAGFELDNMPVSIEEDGVTSTLYACGFFGYGLVNSPLRTEKITREKAEALRGLLFKHFFEKSACEIRVYENLIPLNHKIVSDAPPAFRFLSAMTSSADTFVPQITSLDMPGYDANYDEEDASDIAARFRLVLFSVTTKKRSKLPAQKRSYAAAAGFSLLVNGNPMYSPDYVLTTPWGKDFRDWAQDFAGELRFYVTEPCLLSDALNCLDYVIGIKRVPLAYSRATLDEGVPEHSLVMSFGIFTDPLRGYSELRVAFARPEKPDVLVGGVPLPLPSVNAEASGDELIRFVRALVSLEGILTIDPSTYKYKVFTAEPESVDRLYNTVTGKQVPLVRREHSFIADGSSLIFN